MILTQGIQHIHLHPTHPRTLVSSCSSPWQACPTQPFKRVATPADHHNHEHDDDYVNEDNDDFDYDDESPVSHLLWWVDN